MAFLQEFFDDCQRWEGILRGVWQQSIIGPSLTSILGYVALGIFGVGTVVTFTFTFSNVV